MFLTIWQSAYSSDLYRQVQHWRGKAIAYLAVVLVLCWTPVLIKMHMTINQAIQSAEPGLLAEIPVIEFDHGQVKTPENRPYLIHITGTPQPINFIVDTSGHYQSLDGQDAIILLTKDKCFIRQRAGQVQTYDLSGSQAGRFVLDQEKVRKLIQFFRRWVVILSFVFLVFFSFLKRLMQCLMMALVGLGFVSSLETDLDLGELLSLAIVSMTPAMIMETLWTLTGRALPFVWVFWALLMVGYYLFAINSAATPKAT
jgi:hypothetical protein